MTKKELEKIPFQKWKNLFRRCYNIELLSISHFLIGEEAENGFLELKCFCERLNQTFADISEEDYKIYIMEEGNTVNKKVSITLSTEVQINENLTELDIIKTAFPKIGFDSFLYSMIVKKEIV